MFCVTGTLRAKGRIVALTLSITLVALAAHVMAGERRVFLCQLISDYID
jgi:hypothetical protein